MKRIILLLIFCMAALSGCYASYNIGEGEVTVISPSESLPMIFDHAEPDESAVSSMQSEWEKAQENILPADSETETSAEAAAETAVTTAKELSPAEKIMSEMTLEEKVGQVIFARFPANAKEQMSEYHFGGYTLYAENFEGGTPETVSAYLDEIAAESSIAPFFAADEEGGGVTRVSRYSAYAAENLPSVQKALRNGMTVSEWVEQMAEPLKLTGINLNFAPVADVAADSSDYIYYRTVGRDYKGTAEIIAEIVSEMNSHGLVSCLKHFPGYGSNVDTHTGIAVDSRSREEFEEKDFLPFIAGINAGAPMVMVNHNIVEAYNDSVPASLAPEVHEELRSLGFNGIIITDDLGMDAISLYSDTPYAAAFLAGNDMLCTSSGKDTYNALYSAVTDGTISEERLDESVLRIIETKLEYGIVK